MNICHLKKQHAANVSFVQGRFLSVAQNLSRCECSQALASVILLHSLLVILSTQDNIFPAFLLSSYLPPRSTTSKVLRQTLTLLRRHPSITLAIPNTIHLLRLRHNNAREPQLNPQSTTKTLNTVQITANMPVVSTFALIAPSIQDIASRHLHQKNGPIKL